jgi:hypothetical protein
VTTAAVERIPVRVMVMPAWDTATIQTDGATTVTQLKREALRVTRKTSADEQSYTVKYRGAQVLDESITLRTLGVVPNAPFIVLPTRRQPVR